VRFFPGCPPTEWLGGPMVTVLPTELSVVATYSVTERCAIRMTKERPIASPRMSTTEVVPRAFYFRLN
jgi:hypothetical protein